MIFVVPECYLMSAPSDVLIITMIKRVHFIGKLNPTFMNGIMGNYFFSGAVGMGSMDSAEPINFE